ncbi:uncharacterized protein GIQ15_04984 [Arthroderma uncinatum]|uniref:uncharacterized protein n=1 Tax=Arthroderma uncinatum TaxID=74035 RepID=UPI00144AF73E|nr:uncharacterized protein GIQ15_04984 [Arthroderma uncinatum]KAF3482225.1 hypothetical protein GIQ15_04984 [Arthroderma uncinatum]
MPSFTSSLRSCSSLSGRFQLRSVTRTGLRPSSIHRHQASLFHNTASVRALKEGDRHRDKEEVSSEVEKEKTEHLLRHKEGQGKWNNNLASTSEADVKADRGEIDSVEIEEMEKEIHRGKSVHKKETERVSK